MVNDRSGAASAGTSLYARLPFFYGWVVIAVAFITLGIGVNARTAFSLLYPPILSEFGWTRAATAAAFSVGFMVATVLSPFIGMAMDRSGPRLLIPLAAVIMSVGLVLATYISEPWHLYATFGVLVVGLNVVMSYIGHSTFLPNWFNRRRGLAIGIAFAGVGVGSVIILPWLQTSIDASGLRAGCWALAILVIVVVVPLNLIFQRRRPQDLGLEPDGVVAAAAGGQVSAASATIVDSDWAGIDWTLARAMRTPQFWWLSIGFFAALFAWYGIQVHQTKFLIEVGFGRQQAAWALGLVGFAGIVGQIGVGWLSDHMGREWSWTIAALGFAACYGLLLAMPDHPDAVLLYLMVGAQGLLGFGIAPVYATIPADLFPGRHYGAIFGTLSLAASLGAATGPWLLGYLYDLQGTYESGFQLSIGFCLLSVICIWLAAPRKARALRRP